MDLKNLFVDRELPRSRADLIKRLASEAGATTSEMFRYIIAQVEEGVVIEEAVRDRLAPVVRLAGGLPDDLLARHKAQSAYALHTENIEVLEVLMTLRPEMMEDMSPRMRVLTSGPWTRVMLQMSAAGDDLFPRMALCMLYAATPEDTKALLADFLVGQAEDRPDLARGLWAVAAHAQATGSRLGDDIMDAVTARSARALGIQTVHAPLLDEDGNEVGH